LKAAAYGNGTFVAVGDVDALGNATILTSSEGVTWTPADSGMPGLLTAITYASGMFVAVGELGLILTSTDALNWTVADSGTQINLNGVTYGNGTFVAVGGTNIFTSPDGLAWNSEGAGITTELYAAGFAAGEFLAAGDGTGLFHDGKPVWSRVWQWGLCGRGLLHQYHRAKDRENRDFDRRQHMARAKFADDTGAVRRGLRQWNVCGRRRHERGDFD